MPVDTGFARPLPQVGLAARGAVRRIGRAEQMSSTGAPSARARLIAATASAMPLGFIMRATIATRSGGAGGSGKAGKSDGSTPAPGTIATTGESSGSSPNSLGSSGSRTGSGSRRRSDRPDQKPQHGARDARSTTPSSIHRCPSPVGASTSACAAAPRRESRQAPPSATRCNARCPDSRAHDPHHAEKLGPRSRPAQGCAAHSRAGRAKAFGFDLAA